MIGRIRWIILLLALCILTALQVQAQETPTPEPGAASALLLPEASAFGPGWTQTKTLAVEQLSWGMQVTPDVFREGAVGIFAGPNGARVVAVTLLLTQARVAVRRGWENATQLFSNYAYQLDYDCNKQALWDALPPPPGCAEARRLEGTSRDFAFPTDVTLCAADPDLIVVVVASGLVDDRTGIAASDAVTKAITEVRG